MPLPAALIVGALAVCLFAVVAAGVVGYRGSRRSGRGIIRSIGSGVRWAGRAVLDLF